MKRTVKCILALSLSAFMLGSLTSCKGSNDNTAVTGSAVSADLTGVWVGTGDEISTFTFNSDGTCSDVAGDVYVKGTYTVDAAGGTVTVHEEEYGLTFVYNYTLSGSDLTLQMNNGLPRTFKKK